MSLTRLESDLHGQLFRCNQQPEESLHASGLDRDRDGNFPICRFQLRQFLGADHGRCAAVYHAGAGAEHRRRICRSARSGIHRFLRIGRVYELADRMQVAAPEAVDLSKETDATTSRPRPRSPARALPSRSKTR